MRKYKTGGWNFNEEIEVVEIERQTKHFYVIDGSKYKKQSSAHKFHDSWEEAKKYLVEESENYIQKLKGWLIQANTRLEELNILTPKTPTP